MREVCADLHMHSTASDGCLDANAMYRQASSLGLSCIAITDHDSVAGSKALLDAARSGLFGTNVLRIVSGVEITTIHKHKTVHLLGYGIDVHNAAFEDFLRNSRDRRAKRTFAMAKRLKGAGFDIDVDALAASGKTPNRMLLARTLVDAGEVSSTGEAFATLLSVRSPYYVKNVSPNTVEAIEKIHEAGGFAFIAHPALYKVVDFICELAGAGLDGIEAYHTQQSAEDAASLVSLAHELRLGISGGSDWHGDATHGAHLASNGLEKAELDAFLSCCGLGR